MLTRLLCRADYRFFDCLLLSCAYQPTTTTTAATTTTTTSTKAAA